MLNTKPDPKTLNSIFQHIVENNADEKQILSRGFIIYGYTNTIQSRGNDLVKHLLEFQPLLSEIENEDRVSTLDPSKLTEEEHDVLLEEARDWLQKEGFEVGPLKTQTKLEWVTEAGWTDGLNWNQRDDQIDVEDVE